MAGKVFISYRREDDPSAAARVRDALAARFGKANLFMDIDSLSAGQRFEEELAKALTACDVLIAIIGPRWLDLLTSKIQMSGLRDFVRDEIALALKRKIVVVPVRVGREDNLPQLPRAKDLPPDIRDLVYYQKHDVVHENFARDIAGLAEAIARVRRSRQPKRAFPWAWISAAASVVLSLSLVVYALRTTPGNWALSAPAQSTGSVPRVPAQPNRNELERAAAFINETEDPVRLEAFIKQFPDTEYARIARTRLANLKKQQTPPDSLPPVTECDRLAAAAHSYDPRSVAPAVATKDIEPGRAAVACEEAIAKYPGMARFWYQLGRAHGAGGEADRAITEYGKAIQLDQTYAAAYYDRGYHYSLKQDHDRAIADYTKAIEIEPKTPGAYYNRGLAYYNKQDYEQAMADYNKAIELNPRYAIAYDNRGGVYLKRANYDRAIADFTKAIELDPKAATYYHRGLAYYNKQDYEQAIADYNKVIELDPKKAVGYNSRGYVYLKRADYDRAIADYTKAIEIEPKTAAAYINRGLAYDNKQDHERAMADYTKGIELDPNNALAYNNRGIAYSRRGDYQRAIGDHSEAIRIDPLYTAAFTNRGLAYERVGRRELAVKDFRTALALPQKYDNGEWAHRTARERLSIANAS